jgi:hypothetical protein
MRAYSAPFDLSKFAPERWVTAEKDLDWLADRLDSSKHFPIAPKENLRLLRNASKIERDAAETQEERPPKGFKQRR